MIYRLARKTIYLYGIFGVALLWAQPMTTDYLRTLSETGLFFSLESDWFGSFSPENPRFTKPNAFDTYFRDQMRWELPKMKIATSYSDLLLYGVFIGGIPITPLLSNEDYVPLLLTQIEAMAVNGIITDLIKTGVGRQRPAAYYETRDEGDDANMSFISGHTSFAFSIGTSTAMMLTRSYPEYKNSIWVTSMTLAAATGYFRIAADKHYMTDVLCGAITGYVVGRWVTSRNTDKYFTDSSENSDRSVMYRFSWNI